MNIYEVLVIVTFVMCTIIMISHYIDSNVTKVCDVLILMRIIPCYEIKAYRDGKRLTGIELLEYINKPVKAYKMKEGILYIQIY